MNYIVDSCVWIDFFREKLHFHEISGLLIDNLAATNEVILAELIPSARANNEHDFIDCISGINVASLTIDWNEIIEIQYRCVKSGIHKLGLLDIVIAQNAKQNNMGIFSTDRHMILLSEKMEINCRVE
ncbi:MAG: PIN domain-containing protein [Candidatus Accumulibacter sp.]|jgi:predicted nucleic acid-binding protein|nr:PIN domain-containing protein [Accumulibacter sp.]